MSGRTIAERWLATRLSTLPCSVHRHPAPPEASHPLVTVSLRTAVDVRAIGNPSRVERLTYDVSAWDQGLSSTQVNTLAEQAHDRIDGIPAETVEGGVILSCQRIGAIPIDSIIEGGQTYQRDGGLYRIEVLVHP